MIKHPWLFCALHIYYITRLGIQQKANEHEMPSKFNYIVQRPLKLDYKNLFSISPQNRIKSPPIKTDLPIYFIFNDSS